MGLLNTQLSLIMKPLVVLLGGIVSIWYIIFRHTNSCRRVIKGRGNRNDKESSLFASCEVLSTHYFALQGLFFLGVVKDEE